MTVCCAVFRVERIVTYVLRSCMPDDQRAVAQAIALLRSAWHSLLPPEARAQLSDQTIAELSQQVRFPGLLVAVAVFGCVVLQLENEPTYITAI